MTRWKLEPLKCRGLPILPTPFSPVEWFGFFHGIEVEGGEQERERREGKQNKQNTIDDTLPKLFFSLSFSLSPVQRARKFSAVLGTTSSRSCLIRFECIERKGREGERGEKKEGEEGGAV